jgi:ADP-ribose pyrophosphatase YjhB (NUDIX family)
MGKVRKLPEKQYYKIYSMVPRMTIDLIIFHGDGIVLSKRDIPPCKGMWHLPGGTVLLGERLSEAAVRISREEVELTIKPLGIIGVKEYSRRATFGQAIALVFIAEGIGGRLRGNKYAKEVAVFTKLPKRLIKEQKDMLVDLGIASRDGSLITPLKGLEELRGGFMMFNNRLWRTPS